MVRAKFNVESVKHFATVTIEVTLRAVGPKTGETLNPENVSFSRYTPSGTLTMMIDNPSLAGFFKPGKSYYLDFTEEQAQ
jgi:hypothetical protein